MKGAQNFQKRAKFSEDEIFTCDKGKFWTIIFHPPPHFIRDHQRRRLFLYLTHSPVSKKYKYINKRNTYPACS